MTSITPTTAPLRESTTETEGSKSQLGFWIYLMTDCVLFACLFAAFVVLRHNSVGATSGEIFSLQFVLTETMLLLTSSFTSGLAMLAMRENSVKRVLLWLSVTFFLGASFLTMEIYEFRQLVAEGYSWTSNGFLSAYFTLVGTHGLHILIGLIWLCVMTVLVVKRGFKKSTQQGLTLFSMFWHFLDIVWIFIFTFVYLMGAAL